MLTEQCISRRTNPIPVDSHWALQSAGLGDKRWVCLPCRGDIYTLEDPVSCSRDATNCSCVLLQAFVLAITARGFMG